ncbi:MAG: Wzy polymerase domain-containing protein [Polaromonas sp.]
MTTMAWGWLIAGALSSVMGLLQYFGAKASFSPLMNQTELGEAFANLRQRNHFATLTNISLAALISLVSTCRLTGRALWSGVVAAGLLGLGNAASSSRTGLLQLGFLCVLFAMWGGWRNLAVRRVLLTAVVVYILAMLILPHLAGFGLSEYGMLARLRAGDSRCASRLALWSNVLTLIAQKPWLGWGWGELDYAHFVTLYPGPRFCDILDNAHNLPLHLAVELGIPAALIACTSAGWLVWRAKPWREVDPIRQMAWGVLAVIMLHSLLEYPLWYGPFQIAFGLCVWLLWTTSNVARRGDEILQGEGQQLGTQKAGVFQVTSTLAATMVIAILVWAGVDYYRVSQIYLPVVERSAAYQGDTLNKIRSTWLFHNQVDFAELGVTPLSPANAESIHALAESLLHYSPEPRVIEKLIESAIMLGRDEEARFYLERYRAAFPKEHARWNTQHASP